MKKLLAMFSMVAILGLTVIGCGDDKKPVKEKETKTNADKSSTTEKTTTTKP